MTKFCAVTIKPHIYFGTEGAGDKKGNVTCDIDCSSPKETRAFKSVNCLTNSHPVPSYRCFRAIKLY